MRGMCGLGAILDPAGAARADAPQRMVEALRHRGPDGDAIRRVGPVTLAHTRLAIIDVAGGGQPPPSGGGQTQRSANGGMYAHPPPPARARGAGPPVATG